MRASNNMFLDLVRGTDTQRSEITFEIMLAFSTDQKQESRGNLVLHILP